MAGVVLSQKIELYIKCLELKNKDVLSKSDPFAVVLVNGVEIGRTEVQRDNLNPVFKTPILMEYLFEEIQDIRVALYDSDGSSAKLKEHDKLGHFDTRVGTIMGSRGQQVGRTTTWLDPGRTNHGFNADCGQAQGLRPSDHYRKSGGWGRSRNPACRLFRVRSARSTFQPSSLRFA